MDGLGIDAGTFFAAAVIGAVFGALRRPLTA
jgi:hypothetical protein